VSTALVAIAAAAIVVGALVFVAWPFVSPEPEPPEPALTDAERARLAAAERRDEAYAALRELELDRRTGKLTQEDHAREEARLRAEAAAALRELDRLDRLDSKAHERGYRED
jgi:hypothetical protein